MFSQTLSEKVQDTMFGFGAGVMLAACAFSLVVPGIAAASALGYGAWGAGGIVGAALLIGAAALLLMDRLWPLEQFSKGKECLQTGRPRRAELRLHAIARSTPAHVAAT